MKGKLKAVYLTFSLLYVVLNISSTASHCWMQTIPVYNSSTFKHVKEGLFMRCTEGEEYCIDLDDKKFPEWYLDVRALVIVSCLFSSFAAFVEIIHLAFEEVQKHFTTVVMFIANLFLVIALGMFTNKHEYDFNDYEYGWGFMLSWVAFVIGIGVVVTGYVAVSNKSLKRECDLTEMPEKQA